MRLLEVISTIPKNLDELQGLLVTDEYGGIETSMYQSGNSILLGKITVDDGNKNMGYGSKAMKLICHYADANKLTIFLTPSKDFGASSVSRLKEFYKRFGFVENKGKNKDFTTRETMFRLPK